MRSLISLSIILLLTATVSAQVNQEAAAHYNEGVLAFKENNFEAAVEYYGKAIEVDPRYYKARYNRAKSLLRLGNYKKALGDLGHCTKQQPQEAKVWKYKGYAHMQIKDYPGAIFSYNKASIQGRDR